jgi:hypothetical protein
VTASATNQSPHGGDFPGGPKYPRIGAFPPRSTWSLDFRTLPRRTLWPFCLCTLKSLFPGNGDRLDLRLVRGWEAARLRHDQAMHPSEPGVDFRVILSSLGKKEASVGFQEALDHRSAGMLLTPWTTSREREKRDKCTGSENSGCNAR